MKCSECETDVANPIEKTYHVKDSHGKWRVCDGNFCKWCYVQVFAHDRPSPAGFFRGARVYRC